MLKLIIYWMIISILGFLLFLAIRSNKKLKKNLSIANETILKQKGMMMGLQAEKKNLKTSVSFSKGH